jgi:hypothetical protein
MNKMLCVHNMFVPFEWMEFKSVEEARRVHESPKEGE